MKAIKGLMLASIICDGALLALPGSSVPTFSFSPPLDSENFVENQFFIGDSPLFLAPVVGSELGESSHTVRTSTSVWDCAVMLSKLLENLYHPRNGLRGPLANIHAIEIGAGTGLAGLSLARLMKVHGGSVVLTDVAEVVPALSRNIEVNFPFPGVSVAAQTLNWNFVHADLEVIKKTRNHDGFDLILAADVVWVQELILPFVEVLPSILPFFSLLLLLLLLFFSYNIIIISIILFYRLDSCRLLRFTNDGIISTCQFLES
jgi:hypothetical protein